MGANYIKVNGQLFPIGGGGGTSGVSSVNGRTGAVTLSKADVDLNNVPNVTTDNQTPTVTEASSRTNIASGDTLKTIIGKIKKFFTDLKTVAFTGSYNDLSDTPTIPTVGNGTLTIQKNGTTLKTFSANQSGDATANITLSKSDVGLENVPNVTTNNQEPTFTQASSRANIASGEKLSVILGKIMKWFADLKNVAFTGSYNDLSNKPTIPNVSTKYDYEDPTEAALEASDKVPFYDTSEAKKRNTTWSNIKAKLKTYFDDIYPSKNSLAKVATTGYYSDLHNPPSSLPASDVYAWAKAATKPTYTPSEVGLGNVPNVTTNNQTPTFTQASSRANIASGETLATIFSKMMKWYADLKNVAFSGSSSDINFDSNTDVYEYFLNFWHQNQGVYDTFLTIGYDRIYMQGEDLFELRSHGVRWNNKYKSWNEIIVGGGGGLSATELWTNPSPSSSFAAQGIALSQRLDSFTYFEVVARISNSSTLCISSGLMPVDNGNAKSRCRLMYPAARNRVRDFDCDGGTSMSVTSCSQFTSYGSDTTNTQNGGIIPYKIIGFK